MVLATGLAGAVAACQAPPVEPDIHARESIRRIPAIVDAADAGRADELAAMIRSLDDVDPAVRFFAARSLRELTGHSFGYVYYRDPDDQRDAIDQWRHWYEQQYPDQAPLAGPPAETTPSNAESTHESSRNTPADGRRPLPS